MVREGFLEEEASEITGMSMCLSDRQRAPHRYTVQKKPGGGQESDIFEERDGEKQIWPVVPDAGRAPVSCGQRCGCWAWQEECQGSPRKNKVMER